MRATAVLACVIVSDRCFHSRSLLDFAAMRNARTSGQVSIYAAISVLLSRVRVAR